MIGIPRVHTADPGSLVIGSKLLFLKLRQPDPKRPPTPFDHIRTSAIHGPRPTPSLDATTSPMMLRVAAGLKTRLTLDPTLANDEVRLAGIISEEFRKSSRIASIPASLRDDA